MSTKVYKVLELSVVTLESNPPKYQISAIGQVNSGGWTNGRLEARGDAVGGIQAYDFVADPPKLGTIVTGALSRLPASIAIGQPAIKGIQVFSMTNSLQKIFAAGMFESTAVASGVDYWPWSVKDIPQEAVLTIRDMIGRTIRVVRPGDHVTQEIQPGRITIHLDAASKATDVVVEPSIDA